jgi:hypothetical protein
LFRRAGIEKKLFGPYKEVRSATEHCYAKGPAGFVQEYLFFLFSQQQYWQDSLPTPFFSQSKKPGSNKSGIFAYIVYAFYQSESINY